MPQNLFGMTEQGFFIEVLDHLEEDPSSKTLDVDVYKRQIQYAEHRKTLEKVICTAEKFGATHVSTFAGAWEGKPVESGVS